LCNAADVACDDRFSFSDLVLTDTFTKDNIEYTLEIVGFVQDGSTDPIKVHIHMYRFAFWATLPGHAN
jgi:hypothetical protein